MIFETKKTIKVKNGEFYREYEEGCLIHLVLTNGDIVYRKIESIEDDGFVGSDENKIKSKISYDEIYSLNLDIDKTHKLYEILDVYRL